LHLVDLCKRSLLSYCLRKSQETNDKILDCGKNASL
jgi:hypothetical protein